VELSAKYSPGYIDKLFAIWYDAGKPSARKLWGMIPDDEVVRGKPTHFTIRDWMNSEEWIERTQELDSEVSQHFKEKQIQSKVEMFERHSEIGQEMQRISMGWLRDHVDELTANTAVRMLVEGISIEQGTAGIPDALKKMLSMGDSDLQEEIAQLLADSPTYDADN
jgi:hypothetical protein